MKGTCMVTGGARGIGRATSLLLARDGWDIAVNFRERHDDAQAVVDEVTALGRRAVAVAADVADETQVIALFREAESALGPIAGLVNGAGIAHHNRVEALDGSQLRRMLDVNVIGLMLCCREAARRMSTLRGGAGGAIVNVSSMASAIGGRPGASTYAASKGAVDVFTVGFAKEVAAEGIRVNAVRPGVTDTDMIAPMRSGPRRAEVEASIPMRRFGAREEVAEAIAWLLSGKAAFVTGAHIDVAGGGFLIG